MVHTRPFLFYDGKSPVTKLTNVRQPLMLSLLAGRPLSHISTEDSSPRSSPVFDDRHDDSFQIPEDDPIIQQTTVVVKSVMELSNKVPLSRPNDYVELVKKVGMALRDLMGKVDTLLKELPEQTHHEVLPVVGES